MKKEQMLSNMRMILTEDEMRRIGVYEKDGTVVVDLDVHELTRKQAERLTRKVIYVNRCEFVLNVIHGYNHGTVLKRKVREAFFGTRVVDRRSPAWNPGQTFLTVAA